MKGVFCMKLKEIRVGEIYMLIKKKHGEDIYAYFRGLRGEKVDFSVLEKESLTKC